jgi:hypothetical protein
MQDWHATFLGRRRLSLELSAFELEASFPFNGGERQAIVDRCQPVLKLGLALQMGFLRMTGRPLAALDAVPRALWRHLGTQFAASAPDLASLRVMNRRRSTLYRRSTSISSSPARCCAFAISPKCGAVRWSARCATSWRGWPIAAGCPPWHTAGCTNTG